jgi:Zn-dependent protease/predicted transcriptional regulator
MRTGGVRLGRILGIDVSADLGVLFIGGLLTWSLATAVLPQSDPGRTVGAYWSVALLGALLFLGSLLAHEMSHSVVARRNGIEVEGITLWLFGGVAQFKNEATNAGAEFRIAAAGPAMSFLLSVLFLGSAFGLAQVGVPDLYVVLLGWLGLINGLLAVFNLLPGAPLDGGRVLASALWKLNGDRLRSKISAARAGRFVGLLLIAAGFAEIFYLGSYGGLWTAFIGWFLLGAARMEEAHYVGERALGDLVVSSAMVRDPQVVHSWSTVADTVNGPLRSTSQTAVPVLDFGGNVAGVITMNQVKRVPAEQWATTQVSQVMLPAAFIPAATPTEKLTDLMERLRPEAEGLALVLSEGRLVGVLGPAEIQKAVTIGRMAAKGNRVVRSGGPPPPPPTVPVQHWEPPMASR